MNDQNGYCRTLKQQYAKTAIQSYVVAEFRGGGKPALLSPQVIAIYTELKGMIV